LSGTPVPVTIGPKIRPGLAQIRAVRQASWA